MGIQRWTVNAREMRDLEELEDSEGDWVKYEDHQLLINDLEAEIRDLEREVRYAYQDGKDAAMGDPDHG